VTWRSRQGALSLAGSTTEESRQIVAGSYLVSATLIALLSLGRAGELQAQLATIPDPSELINYAYSIDSGFGGFDVSGRSVQVYRLPISVSLRPLERNHW
jgi:hypothetical protein